MKEMEREGRWHVQEPAQVLPQVREMGLKGGQPASHPIAVRMACLRNAALWFG